MTHAAAPEGLVALPRAPKEQAKIGWTLPVETLQAVGAWVDASGWEAPTIEEIEIIMLETERLLLSSLPSPDATQPREQAMADRRFQLNDRVTKIKGSSWTGHVCGFYSTSLTPVGYCVESENEPGSVQLYPEAALTASRREGDE